MLSWDWFAREDGGGHGCAVNILLASFVFYLFNHHNLHILYIIFLTFIPENMDHDNHSSITTQLTTDFPELTHLT